MARMTEYDEDGTMLPNGPGRTLSQTLLPKKKTPEEEAADAYNAQQATYTKNLADTQAQYAQQAKDTQTQADNAFAASQAKIEASRAAAEQMAKDKATLSDNTKRDLTSSGDAIVVAGGSAGDAAAEDGDLKRKRNTGAISSQLGINV